MQTLIIASNNKNKIREIGEILTDFRIISLKEAGLDVDPEETGTTFAENALIKAKAVFDLSGAPTLADDSGLVVDALGGAPGIYSARYAGHHGDDKANIDKLLKDLSGITDRRAKFVSAVVLVRSADDVLVGTGETLGEILDAPQGMGGFGYDPVFYSYDLKKSFGEATAIEKNGVSHRYRALLDLVKKLYA